MSREVRLVFETNSMLAATISQNASPMYQLCTSKHGDTTDIWTTRTEMVVAQIRRRSLFPDTVTFPDMNRGEPIRINKWLKPRELSNGLSACTLQTPMVIHGRLEVYRCALDPPDGLFASGTRYSPGYESAHAHIMAAFVYEEQVIRIEHRNAEVADARILLTGKPVIPAPLDTCSAPYRHTLALLLTPAPLLVPALFLVPAQLLNSNATFVDKFKLLQHNIGKSEQSFTLL
ncbi:hypothetical protein K438DRAFT_1779668 [Mycena galopus ATCC 62051]|nr:hypothetical protein K438DRAFT_1779668 [Mycena galopus ATCC 62051]